MEKYDPSPLIDLCEGILADGELSSDEVYRLSEFLNATPECTLHWPGRQLAELMVKVWKDGELSHEELDEIALALADIQREWHQQVAGQAPDVPPNLMPAQTLDLRQNFVLPSIHFQTTVTSFSDSAVQYEVNLDGPECDCEDWVTRRSEVPKGHFGRCCKHIVSLLRNIRFQGPLDEFLEAFSETGTTPHPGKDWATALVDGARCFFSSPAFEWSDVLLKTSEGWKRYGFNMADGRWAYQKAPAEAGAIEELIKREFVAS